MSVFCEAAELLFKLLLTIKNKKMKKLQELKKWLEENQGNRCSKYLKHLSLIIFIPLFFISSCNEKKEETVIFDYQVDTARHPEYDKYADTVQNLESSPLER